MSTRLIRTITGLSTDAKVEIWFDTRTKEYPIRFYNGKGVYMGSRLDVHMDSLDGANRTGQMFVSIFGHRT